MHQKQGKHDHPDKSPCNYTNHYTSHIRPIYLKYPHYSKSKLKILQNLDNLFRKNSDKTRSIMDVNVSTEMCICVSISNS